MTEPPQPPPTRAWQPGNPYPPPAWQPPPAPGNQYPQPGYPPPGFAPPPPPPGGFAPPPGWNPATTALLTTKGRRFGGGKTRNVVVGVLAVAALAVLLTGFWKPGFFRNSVLDVHAAENGVRQVLTDPTTGYGATDVTDVRCNNGENPVIKVNATFTCEATIAGTKRTVEVTFADNEGSYWVGSPT